MLLPTFAEAQNAVFASLATDEFFPTISTSDHKGHKGISADGWSSLIGIVTAIVGNIFISVALNTQRYAHIRLNKEWVEKQKQLRRERRAIANGNGQSTQQTRKEDKAKPSVKRRHTNGASVRRSSAVGSLHPATETDPLIPRTSEDEDDDVASDITDKERRAEDAAQTSYLKSPYWWLGLVLMITGEAGNFLAYGFAPASIVSPLGVVALISNCIIAPFMLKERFRTRDGVGVLIAIAGAVTVVVSAKSNNPKLGPDEIWNLIARWEFETYVGLTTLAIIALMVASEKIGGKSIFIDLGVAALFGGYAALSTKGVASLLGLTLFRALTFPVTYLLVFILVFTAIMQIRYLNRALQRFNSTQVIPTQFVLFTLSVILGSAVLYRDFERTSAENVGEFVGGCALTFAGVWLITSGRNHEPDEEEIEEYLDDEEEVEAIHLEDEEYHDVPDHQTEGTAGDHQSRRTSTQVSEPFAIKFPGSRRQSQQISTSPHSPRIVSLEPPSATPRSVPSPSGENPTAPASLVENPWQASQEHSPTETGYFGSLTSQPSRLDQPPPPLLSSVSEPNLLTESQPHRPPPQTPRTPDPSAGAQSHVRPTSSAANARGGHLSTPRTNSSNPFRQSLTELVPGPLIAPLSSSLSAVVADTLRRGVDAASIKRRRSIAKSRLPNMPSPAGVGPTRARGVSEADLGAAAATIATLGRANDGTADREEDPDQTIEEVSPSGGKRGRALGSTVGKLFKSVKLKRKKGAPAGTDSEPATPA